MGIFSLESSNLSRKEKNIPKQIHKIYFIID